MFTVTGGIVGAAIGVLAAVSAFIAVAWSPPGKKLFHLLVRAPATTWLAEGVAPIVESTERTAERVAWLEQEFRPNGGGSIRDKVDGLVRDLRSNSDAHAQIRAVVDRVDSRLVRVEATVDKLTMRQVLLMDIAESATMESNEAMETVFVSRRTAELFGREPFELLGAGWANHIHPDDVPELWSKYEAAQAAGESAAWSDLRIIRPDGSVQWFDSEAIPIVTSDGVLSGYLGVLYGKDGPGQARLG